MAKILCVLFDDPIDGYPKNYARDEMPSISHYEGGQSLPNPSSIDFQPGHLLGSVSGELGLRSYLEKLGHKYIVTSDREGSDSIFARELHDAEIIISQPFWPAYLSQERLAQANNLKLVITAGVGSDHIDLSAAVHKKITVAEVTNSNSISVAEHAVMMILSLVRNYIPSYKYVVEGGWNIADCVSRAYDLEGMHVGTLGAGRIGLGILKRLNPFGVKLHYTDKYRLAKETEKELNLTYHENLESLAKAVDVLTINCPLHPETDGIIDEKLLKKMRRGSYIVNTARGKICNQEAIVNALQTEHLAGYAGDVWYPQPAPKNHPWRHMPNHAMTPHISGATLSAQARYAAGVKEILEAWFANKPIRNEYLIVQNGELAGAGAHAYTTKM
ncbi:NAD-dependent formate dehydrogenase [Fluviispira sanaruensis]|uniref:Formate dehydrogenase n=1 Tax=Fluviispira sanaruensis TaxID=2493639 RepID=A0A4P2VUG1_FLUSA|nr:NAD-dependent formate dehydrogenase [Fluviispira sanaruensis]BBH53125.1 formate dehydrogenase [Fluviispira sanaruensis]